MITRCYLEITNVCNLSCVFCPKTERAKHRLTLDEFDALTSRLEGKVKFLYFHLMGEPFLHPLLPQFVLMARHKGFVPIITTNGTLLSRRADLLDALPHKIQISLHSHEGNAKENLAGYVNEVMAFSLEAAHRGCIVVLRLWNEGGHNRQNDDILNLLALHVPRPWTERHDGWRLATICTSRTITCSSGPTFSTPLTTSRRCSATPCAIRLVCSSTALLCRAVSTITATSRLAICSVRALPTSLTRRGRVLCTTASPVTTLLNRSVSAAAIRLCRRGFASRSAIMLCFQ